MAQRELFYSHTPSTRRLRLQITETPHDSQAVRRAPATASAALEVSGQLPRHDFVPSASHLLQLQRTHGNRYVQRLVQRARSTVPTQARPTRPTSLPDTLKTGIEQLSGLSMADVRVQYNSAEPAKLQALAYTRGTDIHVGPGQEKHLSHEVWHVVQQVQGRVHPLTQMKEGVQGNEDKELEREADVMGAKALHRRRR